MVANAVSNVYQWQLRNNFFHHHLYHIHTGSAIDFSRSPLLKTLLQIWRNQWRTVYCQNISNSDYNCIANYIFEKLQNISTSEQCLKPCKINEYVGKVTFTSEKPNLRTIFVYYFKPPEVKNINEEYILYDINAVISAIGGSLGLCVGFSIRGFNESIWYHLESSCHISIHLSF